MVVVGRVVSNPSRRPIGPIWREEAPPRLNQPLARSLMSGASGLADRWAARKEGPRWREDKPLSIGRDTEREEWEGEMEECLTRLVHLIKGGPRCVCVCV